MDQDNFSKTVESLLVPLAGAKEAGEKTVALLMSDAFSNVLDLFSENAVSYTEPAIKDIVLNVRKTSGLNEDEFDFIAKMQNKPLSFQNLIGEREGFHVLQFKNLGDHTLDPVTLHALLTNPDVDQIKKQNLTSETVSAFLQQSSERKLPVHSQFYAMTAYAEIVKKAAEQKIVTLNFDNQDEEIDFFCNVRGCC